MKDLSTGLCWDANVKTKAKDGYAAAQKRGKGCLHSRNTPFTLNV